MRFQINPEAESRSALIQIAAFLILSGGEAKGAVCLLFCREKEPESRCIHSIRDSASEATKIYFAYGVVPGQIHSSSFLLSQISDIPSLHMPAVSPYG